MLIQECVEAVQAAARRRRAQPRAMDTGKLGAVTAALDGCASTAVACQTSRIKRSTPIDTPTRTG